MLGWHYNGGVDIWGEICSLRFSGNISRGAHTVSTHKYTIIFCIKQKLVYNFEKELCMKRELKNAWNLKL